MKSGKIINTSNCASRSNMGKIQMIHSLSFRMRKELRFFCTLNPSWELLRLINSLSSSSTILLSVTFSELFREFAISKFPELASVNWDLWFHAPGMREYKPPVKPSAVNEAMTLASDWASDENRNIEENVVDWPSGKKCIFIYSLMTQLPSVYAVKRIADEYKFLSTNCQVRCGFNTCGTRWGRSGERMKYTRPMYRELAKVDKELARKQLRRIRIGIIRYVLKWSIEILHK